MIYWCFTTCHPSLDKSEVTFFLVPDIATKVFEITQGKGAYAAIDMLSGNSTKVRHSLNISLIFL